MVALTMVHVRLYSASVSRIGATATAWPEPVSPGRMQKLRPLTRSPPAIITFHAATGYRLRTERNAQRRGTKSATVKIEYLRTRRRSPGGKKLVSLEIINDSFHADLSFIQCDLIAGSNIGCDLAHRFALFKTLPNNHRGFVQLIIFFSIEIYEYSFTAIKIRYHDMFTWRQVDCIHNSSPTTSSLF